MKIYKRFKLMKKSTKIGLATSAVYAAVSLALPAFADVVMPGQSVEHTVEQPIFQPVDVSQIITAEQAENIYNQKIAEYAIDKKIESKEITELVKIKGLEETLMKEEISKIEKEGTELRGKIKGLDAELASCKERLATLDNRIQHPNVKKILEKNLERLEKEVMFFYPGLIKKRDFGVVYDGGTELEKHTRNSFEEVFKETNKILKEYCGDETLDEGSYYFNIRSVLVVYNLLSEHIASIPDDSNAYDAKKEAIKLEQQNLAGKIKKLEAEKILIVDSEPMKQLEDRIKPLQEKLERITKSYTLLKNHDGAFHKIAEYKAKNKDFSKYISLSLVPDLLKHYDRYEVKEVRASLDKAVRSIPDLESYFKEQGFDVSLVDKLHNPARTRIPMLGLWAILGFFGPILRNLATLRYVGSGKATSNDYGGSAVLGLIEGVLGIAFLDSLHPLVYPIRMVGFPFAWHGILRLTGGDKGVYDYAK